MAAALFAMGLIEFHHKIFKYQENFITKTTTQDITDKVRDRKSQEIQRKMNHIQVIKEVTNRIKGRSKIMNGHHFMIPDLPTRMWCPVEQIRTKWKEKAIINQCLQALFPLCCKHSVIYRIFNFMYVMDLSGDAT